MVNFVFLNHNLKKSLTKGRGRSRYKFIELIFKSHNFQCLFKYFFSKNLENLFWKKGKDIEKNGERKGGRRKFKVFVFFIF